MEVLSLPDIEKIHQATLEVLETVGVEFRHDQALEIFKRGGARVDGSRVCLPRAMLDRALSTAPGRFCLEARNSTRSVWIGREDPTVFAPPAGCVYVQELASARRLAGKEDYLKLIRIIQQSPHFGINGGGLVLPDAPGLADAEKFAWMAWAGHWFSDKPQMGQTWNAEIARIVLAMSKIVFQGQPGCHVLGTINPISPLIFPQEMLDSLLLYAGEGQPLIIAPCSMAMATSPTTLAGTLVVNNAEVLAGLILAQLIQPGTPVLYGNTSTISDMRTMAIAIGAPELSLLVSAVNQLARYYKLPSRTGGALTDAKRPDMQAGMESMLSMLATVTGHTSVVMHSAGILDSFLTLSYEKLVLDEETGAMAQRLARGLEVNQQTLAVQEIQARGPGNHFLDTDHTIEHFKQEFWQPTLCDRQVYQPKRDYNGYLLERANKVWQDRVLNYQRPGLPGAVEQELLRYYRERFDSEPVLD